MFAMLVWRDMGSGLQGQADDVRANRVGVVVGVEGRGLRVAGCWRDRARCWGGLGTGERRIMGRGERMRNFFSRWAVNRWSISDGKVAITNAIDKSISDGIPSLKLWLILLSGKKYFFIIF